jgi:hypothetical protein
MSVSTLEGAGNRRHADHEPSLSRTIIMNENDFK